MSDRHRQLAGSIEAIVGSGHITEEPPISVDGLRPKLLARPGNADEVAACLRVCSELGAAVVPAGRMTWLDWGNPLERADVLLGLDRLSRIVDYSPPDLTATVEAGLTLGEFNSVISKERQWLPLDPPGFGSASLGAIAACNSSGALRLRFGTPRDYVIGLKLAHADGTVSKSGGRVVKNVAGYDMNKLYVGSYGTLAIITELTFKLRPLPERSATIVVISKHRGPLVQLAKRMLGSELQPASVVFARQLSPGSLEAPFPEDALLIRFIDSEPSVEHQVEWVMRTMDYNCSATLLSDEQAEAVWAEVADFDGRAIAVRLSVPLAAAQGVAEKTLPAHLECVATADFGTGIIRVAFEGSERSADQINRLRASATAEGGTLVIEKAPAEVRHEVDAWGEVGSTVELQRAIKARFDPQSILNPGKFAAGI